MPSSASTVRQYKTAGQYKAGSRYKTTGRVTPSKRDLRAAKPEGLSARMLGLVSGERWEVSQSRSVRSGWAWRGMLVLSLLALGVAIILAGNHQATLGLLWVVIAAGWFGVSMWLWRMHARYMRGG